MTVDDTPAEPAIRARGLRKAYAGKGDPVHASICYRRAWELHLEAHVIEPTGEDEEAISELARLVPANQLDPRYRVGS